MHISFLSLYADHLTPFFERGLIKRAIENNLVSVDYKNLRDFSDPPHFKVDDHPYSNKRGMLLRYDVLNRALNSFNENAVFIMPDPKGQLFDVSFAQNLSKQENIVFVSPAFEGVDERIFSAFSIKKVSIGDFILLNGDCPSLLMAEAAIRYVPNVIGCSDCLEDDSILSGYLEAPQFTTPQSIDQMAVPDVLLSGNHREIERWKQKESLSRTLFSRPDLLNRLSFDQNMINMIDQLVLEEIE